LVAIVERKSKFSLMRKGENKTAELVATATIELLRPDKDRVLTLTADRGKEFACHEKVAKALECDYYFAPPYSCWQPGLNENTNGLIRQFLPKKSRFEEVAERLVKRVKGCLTGGPERALDTKRLQSCFWGNHWERILRFRVESAILMMMITHHLKSTSRHWYLEGCHAFLKLPVS